MIADIAGDLQVGEAETEEALEMRVIEKRREDGESTKIDWARGMGGEHGARSTEHGVRAKASWVSCSLFLMWAV